MQLDLFQDTPGSHRHRSERNGSKRHPACLPSTGDQGSGNHHSHGHGSSFHPDRPFYSVDFGKLGVVVVCGDIELRMTHAEFKSLDWASDGITQLVCEDAHLQTPRTKKSLSQPYDERELLDLYDAFEDRGIRVFMFPRYVTKVYRMAYGLDIAKANGGDDLADARALHAYLKRYPISMHQPRREFDNERPARQAIYDYREELNADLNLARRFDYASDAVTELLYRNSIHKPGKAGDKTQVMHFLDLKMGNHLIEVAGVFTEPIRYTIASTVIKRNGDRRIRNDTGNPPGFKWLMRNAIGNTAYHHRGGIARSNIYFHGMRSYCVISGDDGNIPLGHLTKDQRAACWIKRRNYSNAVKRFLKSVIRSV